VAGRTVPQKRSDLIRFSQNANGQHYILNGKAIRAQFESKYTPKPPKGEFCFIMPMEVSLHFPDMKRFNLETLEWDSIEIVNASHQMHNEMRRNPEYSNMDSLLVDYPFIRTYGKIKVLAKNDTADLKPAILTYISNCYNEIKSYIKNSIELVANELEDHSIFALIDFGTSLDSMPFKKPIDQQFQETRKEFDGNQIYEEWMQEIDKYLVQVYNEGMSDEISPTWLRFKMDCLGKSGVETLACILIRRLISFCKVFFLLIIGKNIENY